SDALPRRTGRGARHNPPNDFERLHVDVDPGALDADERRSVETTYLRDPSASILSKNESPDVPFTYSLNPYKGCEHGCPYCYARPSHEYWGLSAGLDFETTIFVKEDAPRLLAERLQNRSWTPQAVALSGNTDPYQPVERELEITRGCLQVFRRHRNPVSIITKSGLIRRDLDVLGPMAERGLVGVTMSMTSVDDALAGKLEPRAARPFLRLQTIEALAEAGVPVGILVAPLIPGLTDEQIPAILSAAAERGAQWAGYTILRLPGPVEDVFVDWVEDHFPDRKARILNRLRALRGGTLNAPDFGDRMRGQGEWARVLRQLFRSARRKADLERGGPSLTSDAFRRLPNGQPSLFHS
ncbi:MAG: PA0069 family radical SAM protein, partial [Salinivenus sp.]